MFSKVIYLLGKDIFLLIIFSLLSISLLFNSKSSQILSIKSGISDIVYILLYPQRWYDQLLDLKNENSNLRQKIARFNLDRGLLNKLIVENLIKNINYLKVKYAFSKKIFYN